jgi:hypothetical protein
MTTQHNFCYNCNSVLEIIQPFIEGYMDGLQGIVNSPRNQYCEYVETIDKYTAGNHNGIDMEKQLSDTELDNNCHLFLTSIQYGCIKGYNKIYKHECLLNDANCCTIQNYTFQYIETFCSNWYFQYIEQYLSNKQQITISECSYNDNIQNSLNEQIQHIIDDNIQNSLNEQILHIFDDFL